MDEMNPDEQLGLAIPQFANCVPPILSRRVFVPFCALYTVDLQRRLVNRRENAIDSEPRLSKCANIITRGLPSVLTTKLVGL
jgi:hypothetical protein